MQHRIISKQRQRISNTFVIERNGERYFMKQYFKSCPKKLIKTEYEKHLKIYNLLRNNKKVRTVKPLELNLGQRYVVFEYLPEFIEFKTFFIRNNNIFYVTKKVRNACIEITKAIAYIHENLKYKQFSKFKYDKIKDDILVPILSDICNSNILFSKDKIYLVDFSPTPTMYSVDTCNMLSHYYLDLAHLIYSYELPPIYQWPIYRHNFKFYEDIIVETYLKYRKKAKFNRRNLLYAKEYYLRRYLISVRKSKYTGKIWKCIIKRQLKKIRMELGNRNEERL
jgi:serine/threonine protein kinase